MLVKEYVEGPAAVFYHYLPVGAVFTIMEFLGTEHYLEKGWIERTAAARLAEATTSPVSQPMSEGEEFTVAEERTQAPGDLISLLLGAEGSPSEDL